MHESSLGKQVSNFRIGKGYTQEELADLTGLTVRTIQRIESDESQPRSFTLKAIASVLEVPFDTFLTAKPQQEEPPPVVEPTPPSTASTTSDYFPLLFCLSCFSFLVVPFVHFLIPARLLQKQPAMAPPLRAFAQGIVLGQVVWVVTLHLLLLGLLTYNLLQASNGHSGQNLSYFWVVVGMYALNAVLIGSAFFQAKRLTASLLTVNVG